jgi:hypothetical protein
MPAFAGVATVTNPSAASCTLNLAWSAATAYCGGPIYYNIYRSTSSSFAPDPTPVTGNRIATGVVATSFSDTSGLVSGTPYYYIVRAVDSGNSIEDLNTVTVGGTPNGAGGGVQTLFTDNFENAGTWSSWTVSTGPGPHTCGPWTRTNATTQLPSGGSDYYALTDSDACGSSSTTSTILTSPVINCSVSGLVSVTLDFDLYYRYYNGDTATCEVWNGSSWVAVWTDPNATVNAHQTIVVSTQAVGNANFQVRFSYQNAAWDYWYAVDNVVVTGLVSNPCTTAGTVKPVPDGSWISGTPIKASKNTGDGSSLTLTWDVSTCVDTDYNAYYGIGSQVSSYTLTGSQCALGNSGSATWDPAPAVPGGETFLWWVIVGTDGIQTESSWGKDSAGNERHPAASAQCGFTAKSTATTCP